MPANPEPENPLSSGVDDPIFEEMERIDGAFLDSLDDRRLESGVPEDEKADDEEFLRMSGLTYMRHDKAVNGLERPDSYASRLDEEEFELADPPLSFYEKGVADVDTDMAPEAIEAESSHAADTIPAIQEPSSIAGRGDLSRHVVGDPQAEEGGPSDEEHAADEETDSGDSGSDTEYVAIADEDAEETGTAGGAEEAVSEIETMSSSEQSVPPAGNGISLEQETRAEFFNDEGDDEDHDDELLVGHEEFEAFVGPGEEDDASGIQWDEAIEESAKVLVEKTEGVEEILDAPPEATTEGELAGEQGSDEGEIEGAEPPPDIYGEEVAPEEELNVEAPAGENRLEEEAAAEKSESVTPAEETGNDFVAIEEPDISEEAERSEYTGALTDAERSEEEFAENGTVELPPTDASTPEGDSGEEGETFVEAGIEDIEDSRDAEEVGDKYKPHGNYFDMEPPSVDATSGDYGDGSRIEFDSSARNVPTLGEAQALLRELEAQPRENAENEDNVEENTEDNNKEVIAAKEPPPDLVAAAEKFSRNVSRTVARDKAQAKRRPKSYARRRRARRVVRYFMIAVTIGAVLGVLAVGGYQGFLLVRQQLSSPDVLLAEARDLVAREDYAAAMEQYERVAESLPRGVPERADALFGAASSAFTRGMHGTGGEKVLRAALRLLEEFHHEFPGHPKAARAETLQGILYLELGQTQRAIEILRHPELRLRDPAGALPILRTLARAHTKLGEYDMARRAYLQAARLEDNYTPDEDYCAVSLIYEKLAEYTESPEAKREYLEVALEYWKHAAEVPGLDFIRADELRRRIALLESQLTARVSEDSSSEGISAQEGRHVPLGAMVDKTGLALSGEDGTTQTPRTWEGKNKQTTMGVGSGGS